jgi:type IV pilus assembly protein PilB
LHIKEEQFKKIITENNLVSEAKLIDYQKEAEESKVELQTLLINKKVISEKDLLKLYGADIGISYIDLSEVQVPRETLKKLPEKIAKKYNAVLFEIDENGKYSLAMSDPSDMQATRFIEKQFGKKVIVFITTQAEINAVLDQYREEGFSEAITKAIQENKEISIEEEELEESATVDSVREIVQDAPIAKAVNIILEYAIKSRASDIHIEPRETFIQIRYRIDGVLSDTMTLPKQILSSIVTRVKILANLRIDEHRVPQDGRIKINLAGKTISIRVSTLPVMDGEKVVMRLLDESVKAASLEGLGFRGLALETIKKNLHRAHGMTLVTGPTGSGKSTTLYSLLTLLNDIGVNISTVEDPVEYRIPGVNQTQVNTATGMTFASGLRALLRQDPDIIMVGEIRDKETAEMAIHAALTGHVVLSTLHTNSAAGALPRLEDMGAEPFLIASTVNTVIGQRLVRKICPDCREKYSLDGKALEKIICDFGLKEEYLTVESSDKEKKKLSDLGLTPDDIKKLSDLVGKQPITQILGNAPELFDKVSGKSGNEIRREVFTETDPRTCRMKIGKTSRFSLELYKAVGCNKCEQTGYRGRMGIYESIEITDEMGSMIVRKSSEDELIAEAKKSGFINMYQDGFIKALIGTTTIEEIIRVTQE